MSLALLANNMDKQRGSYEKLSIRDSARSLKKYGSTSSKMITRNEKFVKHFVSNSDTLQGIALKYNVTIEQIRRANKLWASDSLFLREFLLIPIMENANIDSDRLVILTESQSSAFLSSSSVESQCKNLACSSQHSAQSSFDEDNISDFLSKIDASIASTKEVVKKVTTKSIYGLDNEVTERRKPVVSRMKQTLNNNTSNEFHNPLHEFHTSDDVHSVQMTPCTTIKQQGKKIRTSLELHEAQQDELFEL
ncbi:lysM and putative peptidoglycan-binding domain-containing protein 2 [Cylas formicarius]|uniref:lysM and putative peptidoglycan-binding domain-containing protein 2 n=1 Tax=Cylas formicarius TaxID=197179 RepID=UPI0029583636|nr:lysM and putative peptidoglycan-binding domain-containing protein 2 [Cylas formicarius]